MGLHSSPSSLFDRIEAGGSVDRLPKHLVGTRAGLFHLLREQQNRGSSPLRAAGQPLLMVQRPAIADHGQHFVPAQKSLALSYEEEPKPHQVPDIMLEDEFKFRSDLLSITARA